MKRVGRIWAWAELAGRSSRSAHENIMKELKQIVALFNWRSSQADVNRVLCALSFNLRRWLSAAVGRLTC